MIRRLQQRGFSLSGRVVRTGPCKSIRISLPRSHPTLYLVSNSLKSEPSEDSRSHAVVGAELKKTRFIKKLLMKGSGEGKL